MRHPGRRFRSRRDLGLRLAPQYVGGVQVADSGLRPDEERRLRNRALARWLIAAGRARLWPGSQPVKAELVVHNGRACAAVTSADGQVLALYPVWGRGENRRLYKAVPDPASRAIPPPRSPISRADLAALLARSRESCTALGAQIRDSRALREAAALHRARARDLRAGASAPLLAPVVSP